MYEYGPPEGKQNPLSEDDGESKYKFVPLKEQLSGLTNSRQAPSYKPVDNASSAASVSDSAEKPSGYRTGVLEQTVSTTVSLFVAGLLVAFMTVMISYGTVDLRVNMLIVLGVSFLVFSLVSLFGSHIMSKKKREFSFFRAFNGLTVGCGLGFILSTVTFMVQMNMM